MHCLHNGGALVHHFSYYNGYSLEDMLVRLRYDQLWWTTSSLDQRWTKPSLPNAWLSELEIKWNNCAENVSYNARYCWWHTSSIYGRNTLYRLASSQHSARFYHRHACESWHYWLGFDVVSSKWMSLTHMLLMPKIALKRWHHNKLLVIKSELKNLDCFRGVWFACAWCLYNGKQCVFFRIRARAPTWFLKSC